MAAAGNVAAAFVVHVDHSGYCELTLLFVVTNNSVGSRYAAAGIGGAVVFALVARGGRSQTDTL